MTRMDTVCEFSAGEMVYYPTHGVGKMLTLENIKAGDTLLPVYVIEFTRSKMTLRVPAHKVTENGLIPLSSIADRKSIRQAIRTILGKRKVSRQIWKRRMDIFESKVVTGGLEELAEVIRDLSRDIGDDTQSYTERTLRRNYAERLRDILSYVWGSSRLSAGERINKQLTTAGKQPFDFWQ